MALTYLVAVSAWISGAAAGIAYERLRWRRWQRRHREEQEHNR